MASLPKNKYLNLFIAVLLIWILSLFFGAIADKWEIIKIIDRFFYAFFRSIPHLKFIDSLIWPLDKNFLPILQPHPSFLVTLYGGFLIYLAIFKRDLFLWAVVVFIIAVIIARISVLIDTSLVFRQRPYTILPNDVSEAVKHGLKGWTSYPSGHTRDIVLDGTIISIFLKKTKFFMIFFAIFVGFSRLYLGIHYFSDVLAGGILGLSIGIVSVKIMRELQIKFIKKPIV